MRIIHPRPELGRQEDFGVTFVDGVATVDELHPERDLALRQHGFIIDPAPIIDLTTMTKAELRALIPEDQQPPSSATRDELYVLAAEVPVEPLSGDGDAAPATED
ncbi:Uncharacterised protein [Streptococcus pyogenes]|nr:Uncharacterised protein [Streptococcus pyogenes]